MAVTRARTLVLGVALGLVAAGQARRHHDSAARRAAALDVRDEAVDDALATTSTTTGTSSEPLLAVVIAAYNEAGSIGPVLEALPRTICGLRVCPVVIDDGSADETAKEARAAGAVVGSHGRNLGQGDALRTGFELARHLGARVVVTMDADGQHDPAELPDLVGPVAGGDADYVQGSRFLGAYDDAGGARDIGIRGFTRLQLVEDRFSASEILIQAAGQGLRIREVPVHIRSREIGESKKPRGLGYAWGYLGAIIRSWARIHDPRSRS